MLKDFE